MAALFSQSSILVALPAVLQHMWDCVRWVLNPWRKGSTNWGGAVAKLKFLFCCSTLYGVSLLLGGIKQIKISRTEQNLSISKGVAWLVKGGSWSLLSNNSEDFLVPSNVLCSAFSADVGWSPSDLLWRLWRTSRKMPHCGGHFIYSLSGFLSLKHMHGQACSLSSCWKLAGSSH